jgi:hypothetical protein
MKVIFLDIDGVLNGHEIDQDTGHCWIHAALALRLNRIIKATGAKLVISSAWRYMVHCEAMTMRGFEYMLRTHKISGDVIGVTVRDEETPSRGDQIKRWLAEHPEVTSYVILDDEPDGMTIGDVRFVKTDGSRGLSEADMEDAIVWLNDAEAARDGQGG